MADKTLMGMGNWKVAGKRIAIIGISGTAAGYASDAIVERLFTQTATEATSDVRDADAIKMYEAYRGGVQIAGGLVLGKLLWRVNRDVALGVGLGCTWAGLSRIGEAYEWDTKIRDLFSGDTAAAGLGGRGYGRSLPAARSSAVGPMMRERIRIPIDA